ncbi:unnamed protein product [Arabidopsis halleri]
MMILMLFPAKISSNQNTKDYKRTKNSNTNMTLVDTHISHILCTVEKTHLDSQFYESDN